MLIPLRAHLAAPIEAVKARCAGDLHLTQFRAKLRELAPEAEAAAMTIAEQLLQRGRIEGVVQGEQKLLLRQLKARFGEVPTNYEKLVDDATPEQLEQYGDRVPTADSLAAVFGE